MSSSWALIAVFFGSMSALLPQTILLHPFSSGDKYGYMDDDGTVRIPAAYDFATYFSEGLAATAMIASTGVYDAGREGRGCLVSTLEWGFVDTAGNVAIPFRYDDEEAFSEGLAAVRVGTSWGFINATGDWAIRPEFASVGDFHEGLAFVQFLTDGKTGYVDKSGKLVLPAQATASVFAHDFEGGIAVIGGQNGESYTLINHQGRMLIKNQRQIELLGQGLAAYSAGYQERFGIIDAAGNVVVPPQFEAVSPFSEDLAAVKKNGHWGFIDPKGRIVIPATFDDPYGSDFSTEFEFSDGLSAIYSRGHYGYIDRGGKTVIPPMFATAGLFRGGLANACTDDGFGTAHRRCGFIDRTGTFVISPRFGSAKPFYSGWARVEDPVLGSTIYIDRKGHVMNRQSRDYESILQPHGECHFPPPKPALCCQAPASPNYLVTISLKSSPSGASVYLIPMWDWQRHLDGADILADADLLAAYLVPRGTTPINDIKLKAQVYMAVFDLAGTRKVVRLVAGENAAREVSIDFKH